MVLTGSAGERLLEICPGLSNLGDIPAIHRGVILLAPEARSVIEIGSQSARFLTGLGSELPPQFAVNEHCAGGTGSFFEDQMSRLGLRIEDYSNLVAQAESIPRLSGRCAVFAKTDIIHRQQEGIPTPDILLGLCYAMVRNYKAVIVRSLPVERPVALCGGVAQNAGVVQAVKAVFGLEEEDLIIPDPFLHAAAVGAALAAQEAETCSMGELLASLCGQPAAADQLVRRSPLSQPAGVSLTAPASSGVIPLEGCALGIDVGSTSTDLVLMDPDALDTLDDQTFADGMAEVVKYGCIKDAAFFDFLEARPSRGELMAEIEHILYTCCDIKRSVVERDERDTGERMLLNFGHTLGHAYELAGRYETWSHGQAVAAGMCAAAKLGVKLGVTPVDIPARLEGVLSALGLPTAISCTAEDYAAAVGLDKKGAGDSISVILLDKLGRAVPHKMPKAELLEELT